MNVWQYILQPTTASLGPVAITMIFASMLGIVLGIALMVLPKELAHLFTSRTRSKRGEVGLEERRLRAELRAKTGATIITLCSALILALLLRLLGTPGLDTRLLPALVLLTVPFLICYITLYRLFFYPRYLKGSRRIDTNKSYSTTKKSKKIADQKPGKEKISLAPIKAMIGLASGAFIYYIAMIAVSVPPGVQPQNHDHLLHQFGVPIAALLDYLIGLLASLGDDIRTLLPWLKLSGKE